MAYSIKISTANFSKFIDKNVPYAELASGFWLFGDNQESSFLNRAPNAPVAIGTLVGPGTPSYGAGYVDFALPASTVGCAMDSGITPTPAGDFTYISVAQANGQTLCGTYDSVGYSNTLHGSTSAILGTIPAAANVSGAAPTAGAMQFFAFARAAASGGTRKVYVKNAAGMQIANGTGTGSSSSKGFRVGPVGGLGTQTTAGIHRHAAAMLFPSALTDAQITELYDYLKFKLSKRGVNIL